MCVCVCVCENVCTHQNSKNKIIPDTRLWRAGSVCECIYVYKCVCAVFFNAFKYTNVHTHTSIRGKLTPGTWFQGPHAYLCTYTYRLQGFTLPVLHLGNTHTLIHTHLHIYAAETPRTAMMGTGKRMQYSFASTPWPTSEGWRVHITPDAAPGNMYAK
jgi:hypothetical protein